MSRKRERIVEFELILPPFVVKNDGLANELETFDFGSVRP
jgi:hypothetical protein